MTRVLDELSSVLVVLELFGLQSFSLKSLTVKNATENPSAARVLYAFGLLIGVPFLLIFHVAINESLVPPEVNSKSLLMFFVQQSMNLGLLLVVCVSLIQSVTCAKKVKKIFLNSKEITQVCQDEFGILIDAKAIRNSALRRLSIALAFILTLHGAVTITHAGSPAETIFSLLSLLPILFLVMVVYKFVFFVAMCNSQLTFMRLLIVKIFKSKPVRIVENINFHLSTLQPGKSGEDPLSKLRVLSRIYATIYENGNLINESNGLTVLVLLMSLVIAITVAGYESFVIIIGGLPTNQIPGESRRRFRFNLKISKRLFT